MSIGVLDDVSEESGIGFRQVRGPSVEKEFVKTSRAVGFDL